MTKAAATESDAEENRRSRALHDNRAAPPRMPIESKTEKAGTATARTVRAATESVKRADEDQKGRCTTRRPRTCTHHQRDSALGAASPRWATRHRNRSCRRPRRPPVMVVTTAISSVVSAVLSPFAGNSPTAPVDSPLPWMMMAAARQEFGRTPTLTKAANLATTSADVEPAANVTAVGRRSDNSDTTSSPSRRRRRWRACSICPSSGRRSSLPSWRSFIRYRSSVTCCTRSSAIRCSPVWRQAPRCRGMWR